MPNSALLIAEVFAMINLTPVTIYHTIPIYLKEHKRKKASWLQWVHDGIQYGVPVTTLGDALNKAQQMIDAMLALESMGKSA
jgi:hypothetical protein